MELEQTRELLEHIKKDLERAHLLEAERSKTERDGDASGTRLITTLKLVRGILNSRIRELEKEGNSERL